MAGRGLGHGFNGKARQRKEIGRIGYQSIRIVDRKRLGVREDVLPRPAGKIEPYPVGQEAETCGG